MGGRKGVSALSIQFARMVSDDEVKLSANYVVANGIICILTTN